MNIIGNVIGYYIDPEIRYNFLYLIMNIIALSLTSNYDVIILNNIF